MSQISDITVDYPKEEILLAGPHVTVYRSTDPRTGDAVAVKLLARVAGREQQAQRQHYMRVMGAVRALRPSGLPELIDFGFDVDSAYMVMEFVEGIALTQCADASTDRLLRLLAQVADILEGLARVGVSHHNLNPENILVVAGPAGDEVRLLGLGTAAYRGRVVAEKNGDRSQRPDPYTAPERLQAVAGVALEEWRSDLYSLAAIAADMLGAEKRDAGGVEPLVKLPESVRGRVSEADRLEHVLAVALRGDPRQRSLGWADFHNALRTGLPQVEDFGGTVEMALDQLPGAEFLRSPPSEAKGAGSRDESVALDVPAPDGRVDESKDVRDLEAAEEPPPETSPITPSADEPPGSWAPTEETPTLEPAASQEMAANSEHEEGLWTVVPPGESQGLSEAPPPPLTVAPERNDALDELELSGGTPPPERPTPPPAEPQPGELPEPLRDVVREETGPAAEPILPGPPRSVPQREPSFAPEEPPERAPAPPPLPTAAGRTVPPPLPDGYQGRGPTRKRRSMLVVAGALGAALVVIVGLALLWSRPTQEPAEESPAALVLPTPASMPVPTPTELPEVSFHPRLDAAEDALFDGNVDAAREELAALTADDLAAFAEDEATLYKELIQALESEISEEAIEDLRGGLHWGSIKMLRRAVPALSGVPPEKIAEVQGLAKDLDRGRAALRLNASMYEARERGDDALLLERSTALLELLPRNDRARQFRAEAAGSLEQQADELARGGNTSRAVATLEPIARHWPDREGLPERLERYRTLQTQQSQLEREVEEYEAYLATALERGEAGAPDEGLRMLQRRAAPVPLEVRRRQAIATLQARLDALDGTLPTIQLAPHTELLFDKDSPVTITVRITDDFRVVDAVAMVRGQGSSEYREVPLSASDGDLYTLVIGPELHRNDPVEFYIEAIDTSGQFGRLGSPSEPLELKRKGVFKRIFKK